MSYPTRTLGRNGPHVPAIGFGGMSLGRAYGPPLSQTEEKLKVLDHAHAVGARFWDTADIYADSEDRIGDWFKRTGKRDDIFLATKFGLSYGENYAQAENSEPEYVKAACQKSLDRLGVDAIDLYYCHRIDDKTPIEKTIEAMVELKNEGKIRYIGICEVTAATIRRAHAVHPITAYQVEYNPFNRDIESPQLDILNTCRELGIAVVAYSPMGRGLLTGQLKSYDDFSADDLRRSFPQFSPQNFPKIMTLADKFRAVAEKRGCSPSQACLAWVLAQGDDLIPIPGTKSTKYLGENSAAAFVKLNPEDIAELRQAAEATDLPGDRYPGFLMSGILRDSAPL